jgi:hypothetical protein
VNELNKKEVIALLDAKINEVFAAIQKHEGITEGDVEPMDVVELDELTAKAADLIIRITQYQKGN